MIELAAVALLGGCVGGMVGGLLGSQHCLLLIRTLEKRLDHVAVRHEVIHDVAHRALKIRAHGPHGPVK